MGNGTRVRDWATVDYYAMLGITPDADAETVTRAFREEAKRSHPDTNPGAAAAARFSDVAVAYGVLGDRRARREYDQVRAQVAVSPASRRTATAVPVPAPVASGRRPWSRRRAFTVMLAGVLVGLLGIGAAVLTWSMHQHDAQRRARYVPVTATRVDVSGSSYVSFVTRTGVRVQVPEPRQHGDPTTLGPTVGIRYDPAAPRPGHGGREHRGA